MPKKVTTDAELKAYQDERLARASAARPKMLEPGAVAPDFTTEDLAGKPVKLSDYKGKVVVLDFWATWCAPCRKSMPELQTLHERFAAQGLTVLGISIDEKADAKVRRFVTAQRFTYPIAIDEAKDPAWQAYRVKSVPAAFLIDRAGRVVAQWIGGAPPREELEAAIVKQLAIASSGAASAE